jgi:hypothetical protein
MDLAQQLWIPLVPRGHKGRPRVSEPFLLAREVEMPRPSGQRLRDHRTDALHRLELPDARGKDGARVAAQFLQQAVGRDRPDVGQGVQHQECLLFCEISVHR